MGLTEEIKPESWYGIIITGEAQLRSYNNTLNNANSQRVFSPGTWAPLDERGNPAIIPLVPNGSVYATTKGPLNSVLYYWVHDPAMKEALEATEAAGKVLRPFLEPRSSPTPLLK